MWNQHNVSHGVRFRDQGLSFHPPRYQVSGSRGIYAPAQI
jgi:hypothetical protein